ncbi:MULTISPECIES: flagellar export protein FliJ [Yersinia]|uniref:flagellar export protein FliJ n=1 Tax=Yersinia TaxID=629 RepID=UPI0005DD75B0|nr:MULTISPECIES: flagellar export protein FliJ [Yersinia]OVZ95835.1 flagellar protein FliJ [Yersinia frederiksenii]RXA97559.1 flagella biosynthesis chaperone FliJ [Yersinia sp. 2105 StPb PI]CNI29515.1 flagellar biosynthesis chaperone [Yersinia frederiksenii]CNI99592.1 flagellar biosynthesis chaperone [Yersinia frederiksenii]CNK27307.1 flagellar biosynthesis chaperone [Yersinia frederiksenii]
MKNQSPLVTLCELAQKAVEQATTQLGQARLSYQNVEQQLTMLLSYQDEYRMRLNDTLSNGMASSSWQNYQQFIQTLEQAIDQHRNQLAQWNVKVEQAVKHWQEKQQRLNAFETLQERAESTARLQENRLDQKLMDEFAQRASQRSLNS